MTIAAIKAKAATQPTEVLVKCLTMLNSMSMDVAERMTRAAICDVIEEREGEEFIDTLLDELEKAAH